MRGGDSRAGKRAPGLSRASGWRVGGSLSCCCPEEAAELREPPPPPPPFSKPMHEKSGPMYSLDKPESWHKEKNLGSPNGSLNLNNAVKNEELKKCHQEVTAPNKYNSQYHKLFKDIPTEESVVKVCSCALQRDILIQGRLYISPNWLCFYANLFGKDIKVVIPVVSVQLIKKHKTARLLPNGLAITTNASRKEVIVPELKWRRRSSASLSLTLPDSGFQCIHRTSISNLSAKDNSCNSEEPLASESTINSEEEEEEEELVVDQSDKAELRPADYQLLKIFIVLICLLVLSSSYLAFRIFRLEQQLSSLNQDYFSRVSQR
ncbi:GRAM domain-containing protein 2A isoform X4 [Crotalus tigris]|uniref:GRAM domain-containing protein 2A isoform X4 n=1 Tax=Crotalus tigris TaxID=88082 RepID=UPI00192F3401|nr:GRAM domain-containing protein 2A isoform X4 [Crotalus tigris]